MKKIITLLCLIAIVNFSSSQTIFQSNFAHWTTTAPISPSGWYGTSSNIGATNVGQAVTGSLYGARMATLTNTGSTHKRFSTNAIPVVGGGTYEVKIYYTTTQGQLRVGLYDVTNSTYGTYSSYHNVGTLSSNSHVSLTETVTVPATCTSAEIILSVHSSASIGIGWNLGINIDSVAVNVISLPPPPPPPAAAHLKKSIYDIQYTTATSGDSPYADSLVETSGVITAVRSNGYWIQDSASTWNGIYVYDNTNSPSRGDNVTIKAKVNEYYNLTQLKDVDTLIINSTGNTLPTPISINTTELSTQESNEGVLCKVTGATCINPSAGNGEWYIINTSDTGVVDDMLYSYTPTMGYKYDVTGVIQYSFGEYKIEPRDTNDIAQFSTISLVENELKFSIFPNPVNAKLTLTGENIEKAEILEIINCAEKVDYQVSKFSLLPNYIAFGLFLLFLQSC